MPMRGSAGTVPACILKLRARDSGLLRIGTGLYGFGAPGAQTPKSYNALFRAVLFRRVSPIKEKTLK